MCHVTPQLAGQERLREGYSSIQRADRYQIKNRSQVLGTLPHNTQHGQAPVLGAGTTKGHLINTTPYYYQVLRSG